ncbi:helix-turn-helix domain-containing protein [Dictyobacter kobayashii]|uniref:HTH cro/C1-type domain-containing protein n=1 Tax=Dictyobacter kobayashii TaxID=2014872 RepID=A0A402ADC1_9CHLR|nr:helix-turn-helix domain-containing protein [Dictyobacter kobayashii]GCE17107.1 hypothetical protein KDK_09070 [Dictyobacter kobayashii]
MNSRYHQDDLGNILGMLRNRATLTQNELGKEVGVSTTTIRKWESAISAPKASNLKKVIETYIRLGAFTIGSEEQEARSLWQHAALNEAFDAAWFALIANPPASDSEASMTDHSCISPATEKRPPYHNLPQRYYQNFFGRQEELQTLRTLLQPYPRSRYFLVAIDGIGGIGKSTLALEAMYYYYENYGSLALQEHFDALIWISAKRRVLTAQRILQRPQTFTNLLDLYLEIEAVLALSIDRQAPLNQHRRLITYALSKIRTLMVVDNLEEIDDEALLAFLLELPEPTKAIVTTRHRIDVAYTIRLHDLSYRDALALIQFEARHKNIQLTSLIADALYQRTGGLPLAIVWSIGLMSLGYGINSVLQQLDHHHSNITHFCFSEAIERIRQSGTYQLLQALALAEEGISRNKLGEVSGLGNNEGARDAGLAELLQLSLVSQKDDLFSLVPLMRCYVLAQMDQPPSKN